MALKVGLQLYSVRQSLQVDPYGTLAEVADAGYKYIEAANHNAADDPGIGFGVPASKMKDTLERLGMSIVGCHINPLKPELLGQILDYHQVVGNPQIGTDIEFFPHGDIDFVLRRCELFNKIGEMCQNVACATTTTIIIRSFKPLETKQSLRLSWKTQIPI